jgi:hypothetical protein
MLLFAFQTLTSGWFLIVCLLAAAALTFLLYRKAVKFQKPWNYVLPTLRFMGLFFLFLLLLSPFVVLQLQREDKPTLLVYLDYSASAISQTREVYAQGLDKPLSALKEKYNVRVFHFADKVYLPGDTILGRKATDLGIIAEHANEYRDARRVSAVLVVSDGIQNRGISPLVKPFVSNPLLYCIGIGDTTPQTDIRIAGIQVNESVFLGSEYTLEVQLRFDAPAAVAYNLQLQEGGRVLQSQAGNFEKGSTYRRIVFNLKAASPGLKQYRVVVSPVAGEKNLANNQATAVTEVVDDRKNIVVVQAAAHPDVGAIKRLLEGNARYSVNLADPGLMPNPDAADLFIVHGMPVNESQAGWLKRLSDAGKPFLHVSTLQTRRGLLGALPGGASPPASMQSEEVLPQPSADFTEITFEPEVIRRIRSFPPLKAAFGRWQSDATQKVFLKQRIGNIETAYPLYYFREINNHRTVWLCGEGFWRWKLKEFAVHGDALASESLLFQSLQYLSLKARPRSFVLKSIKNDYEAGESAVLQATYLDAAGKKENSAACELLLEGENGYRQLFPMVAYNDVYRLETAGLPAGQYKATSKLNKNPKLTASAVFYVNPMVTEISRTQADHAVLRQWAAKYNGYFAGSDKTKDLVNEMEKQEAAKPIIFSETKVTELIHAKWFFFIIIVCFAGEWILRKYLGSY